MTLGLLPPVASAVEFLDTRSGLEGLLELELAYGMRLRTEDPDDELVAIAHGGVRPNSGNLDDGTLNYDKGSLISNMARATGQLTLRWGHFGAHFRGYAFYDYENEQHERERTALTREGLEQVGSGAEMLDAYLSARFEVANIPVHLRLGDQVVNWGESRFFIGNGVDVSNPINIPLFQQPTSTLRDLPVPVGMLWGSAHITPLLIMEAYYQYDWKEAVLPATGTFLAFNDGFFPGGDFIQSTGTFSQFGTDVSQVTGIPAETLEAVGIAPFNPRFYQTSRTRGDRARDSGQFGLSVGTILPQYNDTKVSLYFANYHANLPGYGVKTPGLESYQQFSVQGIEGLTQALATSGADPDLAPEAARLTQSDRFIEGIKYYEQYREDIRMLGLSFNTTATTTGLSYYGEISHTRGAPINVHSGDLLNQILPGANRDNPFPPVDLSEVTPDELAADYADKRVDGVIKRDRTFLLVGATQFLGAQLGAAQTAITVEAGWLHIHSMPDRGELYLAQPGLVLLDFEPRSAFPTSDSWGYRLAGSLAYLNTFGGVNLRPSFAWSHDVDGISPGGPFRKNRRSLAVGVQADYLNRLQMNLSYINFFGAGEWNLTNDRDNISFSVRYAF